MSIALLAWAGKSFATGIVGATGGMAFNSFLEAVGVPNLSQEALARLEEISTTLNGVALEVSEINGRVKALAKQLNISTLTLASGALENLMSPAITNIQTRYTSGHKAKAAVQQTP